MQLLTLSQATTNIWLKLACELQYMVEITVLGSAPNGSPNRRKTALRNDIHIAVDNPAQHATTRLERSENPQEPHRATTPHRTEKKSILLLHLLTDGALLQRMLQGFESDIDPI
jgi:hypothetical protein